MSMFDMFELLACCLRRFAHISVLLGLISTNVFANQIVIENNHYRYEFSSNQGLSLNKLVNKRVESHNALFNFQQERAIFEVKLVYSDGKEVAFKSTACRVERIHVRDNGESKETICACQAVVGSVKKTLKIGYVCRCYSTYNRTVVI